MGVYIEFVAINNFCIDALICFFSLYFLKRRVCAWRIVVASVFGTFTALWFPVVSLNLILDFILKLLSGAVMVLILYNHKSSAQFFKAFISFLVITAIFGGIFYGLKFLLDANEGYMGIPLGLLILGIFIAVMLLFQCASAYSRLKALKSFLYEIELAIGDRTAKLCGFLDSGNFLRDPLTNLPIIIVSADALYKVLGDDAGKILLNTHEDIKTRTISCTTIAGESKIKICYARFLKIYFKDKTNILYDVMVGISYRGFGQDACYDVLLNPSII